MCGLVALVNLLPNGLTAQQQEVFDTLLFIDQLRGEDSTGTFMVNYDGEVFLAKEASDAVTYQRDPEYLKLRRRAFGSGSLMVGHNRKATKGKINDENAHPFVVDDRIVLVHNGGVFGDHKQLADTEVDSHAIAHIIHKHDGDVTKALNEIHAAYALIWYDVKKDTLNMVRNHHRPLWWMESQDAVYWASEKAMLDFAIARHKLTVRSGPIEFSEDTHQIFERDGRTWKARNQKISIEPKSSSNANAWADYEGYDSCALVTRPTRSSRYLDDDNTEYDWQLELEKKFAEAERLPHSNPPKPLVNIRNYSTSSTLEAEREMLEELGIRVNNQIFRQIFDRTYIYGMKAYGIAFDYRYANGVDDKGGFYLYLRVANDEDVVIRHYWEQRYMTEERIIHHAGTDHVYECTLGSKRWIPYDKGVDMMGPILPDEEGGIIITSDKATLVYGGGVGDKKFHPEALAIKH